MVGAGIFSLLGAAGEVAGAAVWLSFVLAGIIAALQGYSFAKLGARYPSAAGMLEYINRAYGIGHASTVLAWLGYASNGIVTAMRSTSWACRPMVGSSKTYVTSVSDEPRWRIIRVRCASPPLRVPEGRSRVR